MNLSLRDLQAEASATFSSMSRPVTSSSISARLAARMTFASYGKQKAIRYCRIKQCGKNGFCNRMLS